MTIELTTVDVAYLRELLQAAQKPIAAKILAQLNFIPPAHPEMMVDQHNVSALN